jgi:hypothetical protein
LLSPILQEDLDTNTSPPTVSDSDSLEANKNDQWGPLHYPTLMELLDEFNNNIIRNFTGWGGPAAEVNISTCPSPPSPPIPPPPIPPFQPFGYYLRDIRPCQHIFYSSDNIDYELPLGDEPIGMTSVVWCDRITDIHTFRHTRGPKCIERVQEQISYVNFEHNSIFNIPAILYDNFHRESITPELAQHLSAEATYQTTFPLTTINQLVILTIDGLNQGGNMVFFFFF